MSKQHKENWTEDPFIPATKPASDAYREGWDRIFGTPDTSPTPPQKEKRHVKKT